MYDRIFQLCTNKNITLTQLCADNDISYGTYYNWKAGTRHPSDDILQQIADYLGVSLSYLKYGTETEEIMSDGEKLAKLVQDRDFLEHIVPFYNLPDEDKERAYHLISMLQKENNKKQRNNTDDNK